jgi:hypothetical protein
MPWNNLLSWLFAAMLLPASPQTSTKLRVAAVQFRSSFDVGSNCRRIIARLEKLSAQA